MRSGIVYATVIIVLVFLPVFALSGIEGRLFTPLGIAFIVSILASLLVSLTVTPVLCYWLLPRMRNLAEHDTGLVRLLKRWQKAGLEWCFERPAFVIGLPAVAVCIAILAGAALPRAFLPTFNEGTVLVSVVLQPGISLAESNRIGRLAEEIIAGVPEVRSVGRRTGRAELDEHAEGVHNSELDVDLQNVGAQPRRGAGRHPQAAVRAADEHHRRPTDRAPARSHAVGRTRADRAQDLRR